MAKLPAARIPDPRYIVATLAEPVIVPFPNGQDAPTLEGEEAPSPNSARSGGAAPPCDTALPCHNPALPCDDPALPCDDPALPCDDLSFPEFLRRSPSPSPGTARESRHCSATTAAGEPCKAWAVHDTNPPLCSAHAGRNVGAGAPIGNQNRTTHGFYSSVLTRNELADTLEGAGLNTLQSEITCTRAALRRLFKHLAEAGDDLSPLEYARVASVVFHGARTISRLMRDNHAIGGQPPDAFDGAMNEALDFLSEAWGLEL